MDAGLVTLILAIIGFAAGFIKLYVDNVDLKREIERKDEKIAELKEFIKNSK